MNDSRPCRHVREIFWAIGGQPAHSTPQILSESLIFQMAIASLNKNKNTPNEGWHWPSQ